jgi:azurin
MEALWMHQQHNAKNEELLKALLESPVADARVAAATVKQFWETSAAANNEVTEEKPVETKKSGILSDTPELTTIRIGTLVEQMKYDTTKLTVKAGKKIKLTFANPDFLPHNIVLVNPGKTEAVAAAAIAMGAEGFKTGFVPPSSDVIWASKLIDHGKEQVIEFTAPSKPGEYPYVCTFPGHAMMMRGVLTVK